MEDIQEKGKQQSEEPIPMEERSQVISELSEREQLQQSLTEVMVKIFEALKEKLFGVKWDIIVTGRPEPGHDMLLSQTVALVISEQGVLVKHKLGLITVSLEELDKVINLAYVFLSHDPAFQTALSTARLSELFVPK